MSPPLEQTGASHWDLFGPALPADLTGQRVLDVGLAGERDRTSKEIAARGAAEFVRWEPPQPLVAEQGGFDLVICRDVLQRDPHPSSLLTRLWEAMVEGGILLLESRIMTAAERSMYAEFVASKAGIGASEWLPGRLALRWSIETSSFDVDRWLSIGDGNAEASEASAYLLAVRAPRTPSLYLATPAEPKEAPDRRE
jgi:hypothetical protein